MRTKVIIIQLCIIFLFSITIFAQSEKSLKEKLSEIEGDVTKIVISTDSSEMIFEGEEAKQLLKKIKSTKKEKHLKWISKNDIDCSDSNVFIIKSKGGKKHLLNHGGKDIQIFHHKALEDLDLVGEEKNIKITIDDEDGNKKVTITTIEDGKEKVEHFEGEEADEYLEKAHKEHEILIEFDEDFTSDNVFIHKGDFDNKNIEKKIEVRLEDGVKNVTVTTIKDGEKIVKTYSGDEADEFLKNEENEDENIKVVCKKVIKKIKVKK